MATGGETTVTGAFYGLLALSILELGFLFFLLIFGVSSIVLLLRYHYLEFNTLYIVRVSFVTTSFVLLLSLILGDDFLWSSQSGVIPLPEAAQWTFCRLSVGLSVAFAEPTYLLLLAIMLSSKVSTPYVAKNLNSKVLLYVGLGIVPQFLLQLPMLVMSPSLPIPLDILGTYDAHAGVCVTPIYSLAFLSLSMVVMLTLYNLSSSRLRAAVMNRTLRARLYRAQVAFSLLVALSVTARVVAFATTIDRKTLTFALLVEVHRLAELIMILMGVWTFAARPVMDSMGDPLSRLSETTYEELLRGPSHDSSVPPTPAADASPEPSVSYDEGVNLAKKGSINGTGHKGDYVGADWT